MERPEKRPLWQQWNAVALENLGELALQTKGTRNLEVGEILWFNIIHPDEYDGREFPVQVVWHYFDIERTDLRTISTSLDKWQFSFGTHFPTLKPSILRFRYHLLEPQEPWFPAVMDVKWRGEEVKADQGRHHSSRMLCYFTLGLYWHDMFIYIYICIYIYMYVYTYDMWYKIYCNTLNSRNAPLILAQRLLLKGPFAKSGWPNWPLSFHGGPQRRDQDEIAGGGRCWEVLSNKRLLLILLFRLSVDLHTCFMSMIMGGWLYYGHGYL